MKMKQIEVTIMGQSYLLGCPPGGDTALLEAVNTVDREMTAIKEAGRVKARERIAVLAALNLAYALAGKAPEGEATLAGDARAAQARQATQEASIAASNSNPSTEIIDALVMRLDKALADDGQLL